LTLIVYFKFSNQLFIKLFLCYWGIYVININFFYFSQALNFIVSLSILCFINQVGRHFIVVISSHSLDSEVLYRAGLVTQSHRVMIESDNVNLI